MNRRQFVTTTAAGTLLASSRALGANDRIRIGLIGTGGRCMYLARLLKTLPGTEFIATSDAYEPRRIAAAEKMGAQPVNDYREILDRKDVDAVVIGAPDHWHVRMTLDAVAAGKDVYVEKPVTHDISEGEKLIAGVEQSKRVVATGTQQRSWEHYILAKQLVQGGKLGQITLAEMYWYQNYIRPTWQDPDSQIDPAKLDWQKFLGGAPDQAFDPLRFRRWRFFWDFGGGIFTDLMTHWIDVVQWFMGSPTIKSVQASGSKHAIPQFQCPDTVNASILFPQNFTAVYNGTMVSSIEDGGIIFRGSEGVMKLTRDGFRVYPEGASQRVDGFPEPEIVVKSSGDGTLTNLRNWLDCVRSRALPNAHVRAGVEAANASHLANLAMRQGKVLGPAGA